MKLWDAATEWILLARKSVEHATVQVEARMSLVLSD